MSKWSLQTFQIVDLGTRNDTLWQSAGPASPPNLASPASHQITGRQGGRRQGRSLKIRRTPEGGAWRDEIQMKICRICIARQAPPLPPAPAQSHKKVNFVRASISTLFFLENLQLLRKCNQTGIPLDVQICNNCTKMLP